MIVTLIETKRVPTFNLLRELTQQWLKSNLFFSNHKLNVDGHFVLKWDTVTHKNLKTKFPEVTTK